MFQNVVRINSIQIDQSSVLRTSDEYLRTRTLDERNQSQPIINANYGFNTLQSNYSWKYTYPVGVTPVVDFSTLNLNNFPFQVSTNSRSSTLINPYIFRSWLQLSRIRQGPLSDLDLDSKSVSAVGGFFIKTYSKQSFLDSMLQYYSQNESVDFKVVNVSDYKDYNGYILRNKQFQPSSYERATFIYRFYLRSINERFQGRQNIFTRTLPPDSFFDSYSLVTYIQPLSIWLQDKDLYINFTTQYRASKNNLVRIKISNVDTIFTKQRLNTIIISYKTGQRLTIYLNGIKFSPIIAQTGQSSGGKAYDVLLFYKNTVGQYESLGILQTQFSMNRQQISSFAYLFGNRPMPLINTVDKYYQFKTITDSGQVKQFRTDFGKWYNQFVISQLEDNLSPKDVFKHSFKDLLLLGRSLTTRQINTLNGSSPISLLSNLQTSGADQILILDQQTTSVESQGTSVVTTGAVWNQLNFVYNESQYNQGSFSYNTQQNLNVWIFGGSLIYDFYRNCILNYQGSNILKNVRFSTSQMRFSTSTDIGYVSKKNGMLIFTGDIFKTNGMLIDYMTSSSGTYYTDMLRQRNIYKKIYLCQTGSTYMQSFIGKKYITKIGLYNKKNQLLAIGSVSKPLRIDQNHNVVMKTKLEF